MLCTLSQQHASLKHYVSRPGRSGRRVNQRSLASGQRLDDRWRADAPRSGRSLPRPAEDSVVRARFKWRLVKMKSRLMWARGHLMRLFVSARAKLHESLCVFKQAGENGRWAKFRKARKWCQPGGSTK